MRNFNKIFSYLILVILIASCSHQSSQKAHPLWTQIAVNDLKAIVQMIKDNHPGAKDDKVSFPNSLKYNYKQALEMATGVENFSDYTLVLRKFVNSIQDQHVGLEFDLSSNMINWSHFLVTFQDGHYLVGKSLHPQIKVGDELMSCDQKSTDQLFKERIFPYYGLNKSESTKFLMAPYLLLNQGDHFHPLPSSCMFQSKKNQSLYEVELNSTLINKQEFLMMVNEISKKDPAEFSLRKIKGGGYWVALPTFNPEKRQINEIGQLIRKFKNEIGLIRKSPFIVFDVRGNTGGNSIWGEKFVHTLWKHSNFSEAAIIDHRSSLGNVRHYQTITANLEKTFGPSSSFVQYFKEITQGMTKALNEGKDFYRWTNKADGVSNSLAKEGIIPPVIQGKIYLLTDGHCMSSCLDFADLVLQFPQTFHIGQTTNADTMYMEVRSENLPSSNGKIFFPTKVYRNRKRKNNIPYQPTGKYYWHQPIHLTENLEQWVYKLSKDKDGYLD